MIGMIKYAPLIFWLWVCGVFSGCSLVLPQRSGVQQHYVLADHFTARPPTERRLNRRVLIRATTANAFIDTDRIVFSRQSGTRGYYQFARWTESPPQRFTALLRSSVERAALFQSVALTTSGTTADLLLTSELINFYHDAVRQPGSVTVDVRASLIDHRKRNIVSQKSFHKSIGIVQYNAGGAVQGFNRAVTQILDEIVVWLEHVALHF